MVHIRNLSFGATVNSSRSKRCFDPILLQYGGQYGGSCTWNASSPFPRRAFFTLWPSPTFSLEGNGSSLSGTNPQPREENQCRRRFRHSNIPSFQIQTCHRPSVQRPCCDRPRTPTYARGFASSSATLSSPTLSFPKSTDLKPSSSTLRKPPQFPSTPHDRPKYKSRSRRIVWTSLGWISIGIFIGFHVISWREVNGNSMQPTLRPSDHVLVDHIVSWPEALHQTALTNPDPNNPCPEIVKKGSDGGWMWKLWSGILDWSWIAKGRWIQGIQRGDVVLYYAPEDPNYQVIKRIIALPHDLVIPRPDTPLSIEAGGPGHAIAIPAGHCWVEGDDPIHSKDSNEIGPIPLSLIYGRATYIVWPSHRRGPIPPREEWKDLGRVKIPVLRRTSVPQGGGRVGLY